MATITVNSPADVMIDGISSGQVADVIKNHPQYASDVQRALATWWGGLVSSHDSAIKAAIDAAKEATEQNATLTLAVADLQTKVESLAEQVAGKAGEYKVVTTPMQEVALKLAAGEASVPEWLNGKITEFLTGIVQQHQQLLVGLALQHYPALPDAVKAEVLAVFDANYLLKATLDQQIAALRDFGLTRFLTLDAERQAKIGAMLAAAVG